MKCAANSIKQAADELREVVLKDEFTDEAVADTVYRYICRWLVAKKRVYFIKWFCENNLFVNREMFRFCSNVKHGENKKTHLNTTISFGLMTAQSITLVLLDQWNQLVYSNVS